MNLYVMRHGPAEDDSPTGRDADRALTKPGRDRVLAVARLLLRSDEAPESIICSPLVRAVETAEIVAEACGIAPAALVYRTELALGGRSTALAREVLAADNRRVMLVGHQPDLSDLVADLTSTSLEFQKAMVIGIEAAPSAPPRLRFVLDPSALALRFV